MSIINYYYLLSDVLKNKNSTCHLSLSKFISVTKADFDRPNLIAQRYLRNITSKLIFRTNS